MQIDETSRLSDRVERAALEDLHSMAPPEAHKSLGLRLETVGTALVSMSTGEPSILVNRTIGLGLEAPANRDDVEKIVAMYADAGISRYYLHLHPQAQPAELRDWLLAAGLEPGRGWMKFKRGTEPAPEPRSDLEIRLIGPEHAYDFGRIVAAGFDLLDASISMLASLVDSERWRLYVSFDGDTPAGAAGVFIDHGVAWLDWASTLPEFRRRGLQGATLTRRIGDALELGCHAMFTETGEAVEGDPQHSYRNIERFGFEAADLRENFVPAVRPD
jgi:GNAT superfamily N-acetyltransferase